MKKVITPFVSSLLIFVVTFLFQGCRDFNIVWSPVKNITYTKKPIVKVYIENSGSMDGYMCDGSELKDAVYGYVSSLKSYSDTVQLNYINSQIVQYSGSLKSFIKDLTPTKFRAVGGSHANSVIGEMLTQILDAQDNRTVSVFVSDCILDVPQGDAKNFLVNNQIEIRNALVKKLEEDKDLGVEIFRMESKFSGIYYYAKGSEYLTGVQRPYYLWVIGNKKLLAYLNANVPFSEIPHGYKNYYAYSTYQEVPFEITNQFGMVQNPCVCKTSINGQYIIKVKVDLSSMLQDETMIRAKDRYQTQNGQVRVVSVEKINNTQDKYTHVLTLNINKGISSCGLNLKFVLPDIPDWIESVNDDTGQNVTGNISKTTGIKNILLGISDAYRNHRDLAGVKFVINN